MTPSFLTFISTANARLRAVLAAPKPGTCLVAVVGNSAGDADSLLSALVYASYLALAPSGRRLLHSLLGAATLSNDVDTATQLEVVPFFSCLPHDLVFRRETLWLLQAATGLDAAAAAAAVPTIDDLVAAAAALPAASLNLVLVDHNKLDGALAAAHGAATLGRRVCHILDHHADCGAHAHVTPPTGRVISWDAALGRGVASTTTLAARAWLAAGEEGEGGAMPPAAAALCRGVILLDSAGLDPAAGRVTPSDVDAVEALESLLARCAAPPALCPDRAALFTSLQQLKTDPAWWEGLEDVHWLRYDYKCFTGPSGSSPVVYGMSSVCAPLASRWATTLAPAAAAYAAAAGLRFLVLMSLADGQRQLAVVAPSGDGDSSGAPSPSQLIEALGAAAPELRLRVLPCPAPPAGVDAVLCVQDNAKATRKQVQPAIQAALAALVSTT